jgi:hypothetical protein
MDPHDACRTDPHDACRAFLDEWPEICQNSEPAAALAHAEEGLRRVAALGNPRALYARAQTLYGSSFRRTDPAKTVEIIRGTLKIYRTIDERDDQIDAARRLGVALGDLPDPEYEEALSLLDWAAKLADERGDEEMVAKISIEVSLMVGELGDYVAAFRGLTDAAPKLSGLYLENTTLNAHLAMTYAKREGQKIPLTAREHGLQNLHRSRLTAETLERYGKNPPLAQHFGVSPKLTDADASSRWMIGLLLDDQRQWKTAEPILERVRKDFVEMGFKIKVATVSLDLGEVYVKLRRWGKLHRVALEACALLIDSPRLHEAFTLYAIAVKGKQIEDVQIATMDCRAALEAHQKAA